MDTGGAEVTAEKDLQYNWQEVLKALKQRLLKDGDQDDPVVFRTLCLYGGHPQDPVYRIMWYNRESGERIVLIKLNEFPMFFWEENWQGSPNFIKYRTREHQNCKYAHITDMTQDEMNQFLKIASLKPIKRDAVYDRSGAFEMSKAIGWGVGAKGYVF